MMDEIWLPPRFCPSPPAHPVLGGQCRDPEGSIGAPEPSGSFPPPPGGGTGGGPGQVPRERRRERRSGDALPAHQHPNPPGGWAHHGGRRALGSPPDEHPGGHKEEHAGEQLL
ncbi:GTP cyclohydrolase 1 feedback regulatory protein isoform X2 [Passer montanus]|uniref:GTP cyclohydrolase 1 feedback regulatory protein isoform X2 n=1 Tax=Passer montanus TaxID=9160 RepID=UPI0019612294|nr:GTP cyclohydrolase 1 feedback regulatory protein isoform X2 [Passer montanus]